MAGLLPPIERLPKRVLGFLFDRLAALGFAEVFAVGLNQTNPTGRPPVTSGDRHPTQTHNSVLSQDG